MSERFSRPPIGHAYCCVVGSPIAHSKSPQIHQRFAAQFALNLVYERVEVHAGQLERAVHEFRDCDGRGLNVTVPLKEEAYALASRCSERAQRAGASNTLYFDEQGELVADNTDGVGLVRDLASNCGVALDHATVLLLGAGGAARGVVAPLFEAGVQALQLSNRTESRAQNLACELGDCGPISVVPWGQVGKEAPDIVVNATALSLDGKLPPLASDALTPGSFCYDMMYASAPTVFVQWARDAGLRASDGLGMLVEQAAESFEIWHGLRPETATVIEAIRNTA